MYAALVLELGVSALACYHEHYLLETADSILVQADNLSLPALALCIAHIHTVQLGGKQSRLVSACACADFHHNVLVIVGILWKQENFQFLLQLFDSLFRVSQLFLG